MILRMIKGVSHAMLVTSISEVRYTNHMSTGSSSAIGDLLSKYKVAKPNKFVTREYQDYGYRLAADLGDLKHKSLHIKLAKEVPRGLLEQACSFVIDADNAKSKARLFMWKLKQLRESHAKREESEN